ncbi:MAG: phosphotransferase [Actinomycetes bacterium]
MDDGEWLAGNVGGVHKVGETVHRPVGPWTPAVHALLDHLAARVPHVPRVLGFDERGREVLDFLPGRVVDLDEESLSEAQIHALVSWTRTFHAAVADFAHEGPWRYFAVPHPTVVGHNDLAPYNTCFEGDALVGVFDWDLAGPTTPLNELAFIAWNCVPLWADIDPSHAARRLRLIAQTYGGFTAEQVLLAVPGRIRLMMEGIVASAASGDPGMANLVAGGEPERDRAALAGLLDRIPRLVADLRSSTG